MAVEHARNIYWKTLISNVHYDQNISMKRLFYQKKGSPSVNLTRANLGWTLDQSQSVDHDRPTTPFHRSPLSSLHAPPPPSD